jgi:hypothetical protein
MMDGATAPGLGPGGTNESAARSHGAEAPALPYARAFVVQFSADTDSGLEHATGRVEHLQTGRQLRFTSVAELVTCIAALLGDMPPP